MEYYYVTFRCFHGTLGQTAIQQQDAGEEGFNLAGVHKYIAASMGEPICIENWHKITATRYEEFKRFLVNQAKAQAPEEPKKAKTPVLQLHPGGKHVSGNETRSSETGSEPTIDSVAPGSGTSPDVRQEEVRSPQLETGDRNVPVDGGSSPPPSSL